MLEVDVDIRRLVTFFRYEALDKHGHTAWIDLCDTQAKTHGRVRGGTTPLAQDILRTCKRNDVVDRQKVRFVLEVGNQSELMFDKFDNFSRHPIGPASPHTLLCQAAQITCRCLAIGNDFVWVFITQFVE